MGLEVKPIGLQYATPVRGSRRDVFGPVACLCGVLHLALFMGFRYSPVGQWIGLVIVIGAAFGTLSTAFAVVAVVTTRGSSRFAWVTVGLYAVVFLLRAIAVF